MYLRVSYNGNTSAFQADAVGPIPSTRSKRVVVQFGSIRALGARGRRFKSYLPDARIAQLVEQGSCKAQVVGSNPIPGSI